jgi:hypothetical protein
VKNASGNFVKAELSSVTAAAAEAAKAMPDDFRVSITNVGRKCVSHFEFYLAAHLEQAKRKRR